MFTFGEKKNVVKYREVLADCETDYLQNFLLVVMFLLTAKLIKKSCMKQT